MKKFILFLCAAFIIVSAFIPRDYKSGIQGTIDPPEGAKRIWAVSGMDSASTVPISGRFALEVNAGTWKVFIDAAGPYKNAVLENIIVKEDQVTDAGVIKLSQ